MGKKIQRKSKKSLHKFFIGVAAVVAVILGLVTLNFIQVRKDAARFAEADRIKQSVFSDLIKEIGVDPILTEEKDVCYNTEQGPYDDGILWCSVSSAAYFAQERSEDEIQNLFSNLVRAKGIQGKETPASGYVFYGADNLVCVLTVRHGISATTPGSYFPDNSSARETVILECADRAKAKHYEFVGP